MADYFGSSGALISVALETAGFYYQSWMLDSFTKLFEGSGGGFLYLIGAVTAVMSVMMFGAYRFAAWLLLGPGLFMMIIGARTETKGANWVFGAEQRSVTERDDAIAQLITASSGNAAEAAGKTVRVSSLFAYYNRLVSSTVRNIVGVINGNKPKADGKFMLRAETFGRLTSLTSEESDFRELLHLALFRDCRVGIEAARKFATEHEIAAPPRIGPNQVGTNGAVVWNDELRTRWRIYQSEFVSKRVTLLSGEARYIALLYVDYPDLARQVETNSSSQITLGSPPDHNNPVIVQRSASLRINELLGAMDARENAGVFPAGAERVRQLDTQIRRISQAAFTCEQVWGFAYLGLHRYAQRALASALDNAANNGLDRKQFLDDLRSLAGFERTAQRAVAVWVPDQTGTPTSPGGRYVYQNVDATDQQTLALDGLYRIIARYLLRNEMTEPSTSAFIQDFSRRAGEFRIIEQPAENDMSLTERTRNANREWSERTRIVTTATKMPYYQGLGLFVLGLSFPFFALLLLIPGKHPGFLLWFLIWLWLKSWDIGFACVMLLEDILFSIFAHSITPRPAMEANAFDLVEALRATDPSFHLTAYYTIIGVALISIPTISSYLILGSLQAGAGLIASGMTMKDMLVADRAVYAHTQEQIDRVRGSLQDRQSHRVLQYLFESIPGLQYSGVSMPNEDEMGNNPRGPQWRGKHHSQLRSSMRTAASVEGWATFRAGPAGSALERATDPKLSPDAPGAVKAGAATQSAASWIGTHPAVLARFYRDRYSSVRTSEIARLASWSKWDEMPQQQTRRELAHAVMNLQLPLPWVEDGGFDKELDAELNWYLQDLKGLDAYLQFLKPGATKSSGPARQNPETHPQRNNSQDGYGPGSDGGGDAG